MTENQPPIFEGPVSMGNPFCGRRYSSRRPARDVKTVSTWASTASTLWRRYQVRFGNSARPVPPPSGRDFTGLVVVVSGDLDETLGIRLRGRHWPHHGHRAS